MCHRTNLFASAMGVLAWASVTSWTPAHADSAPTTHVLNVTARIDSGCRVVGQSQVTGVDFGELDFGHYPSIFAQPLTAQAKLSSATLKLQCVGVTSAYLTIDGGMHAVGSQRRLESGGNYVPYELFLDQAGAEALSIDTPRSVPFPEDGGSDGIELPVYGRVPPASGGYAPGSYQDLVQVTVSW